ncbi:bifunctional folylpolyglutamate synthase/dihydrofolate synthase [Diplocloster modestus]|uniref:tetrahydrofolate synthase n=1 Tax=Diplocloster modestus TaxID=2850322 RepID=A0ABS6K6A5_9FIRM|nr:bifunctional folylpolyglutamate synthase/dihydrofolate synthase [Diplocloster modestus]
MTYEEAVSYLLDIPKFTKKNDLNHTRRLLQNLGNPGHQMKIIHVAGTNGKGSVCAYVNSVLRTAGYSVGMFTSPHLECVNERFQINGKNVENEQLVHAFERVDRAVSVMQREGMPHPTFFEYLFAMAMVMFEENHVEYGVLETGLGGRLDATNAIKDPAVTVITSISLDHMEWLGSTIEEIAAEKAGIIKAGVPVVYDAAKDAVNRVVERQAVKMGAPTRPVHDEIITKLLNTDKTVDFSYCSRYYGCIGMTVHSAAAYQVRNAVLALQALEVLDTGHEISREAMQQGISNMRWPGRMEEVLPDVYLDGAHNVDGICGFAETVRVFQERGPKVLLFSAVKEKQYPQMIQTIIEADLFDSYVITQLSSGRGVPSDELKRIFEERTSKKVTAVPDMEQAFQTAIERTGDGMLFCAGSLYLVGELKEVIRRRYNAEL